MALVVRLARAVGLPGDAELGEHLGVPIVEASDSADVLTTKELDTLGPHVDAPAAAHEHLLVDEGAQRAVYR